MNATSMNVSQKIYLQLSDASRTYKISKRELVSKIFLCCHENLNFDLFELGVLTKYQVLADGDSWKCLRIDFNETQADVFLFYRNRFRISLSKLFSVAFVLFFDKIIKELSSDLEVGMEIVECFLNSYTEIKMYLYNYIEDALKYFNIYYKILNSE